MSPKKIQKRLPLQADIEIREKNECHPVDSITLNLVFQKSLRETAIGLLLLRNNLSVNGLVESIIKIKVLVVEPNLEAAKYLFQV